MADCLVAGSLRLLSLVAQRLAGLLPVLPVPFGSGQLRAEALHLSGICSLGGDQLLPALLPRELLAVLAAQFAAR